MQSECSTQTRVSGLSPVWLVWRLALWVIRNVHKSGPTLSMLLWAALSMLLALDRHFCHHVPPSPGAKNLGSPYLGLEPPEQRQASRFFVRLCVTCFIAVIQSCLSISDWLSLSLTASLSLFVSLLLSVLLSLNLSLLPLYLSIPAPLPPLLPFLCVSLSCFKPS